MPPMESTAKPCDQVAAGNQQPRDKLGTGRQKVSFGFAVIKSLGLTPVIRS